MSVTDWRRRRAFVQRARAAVRATPTLSAEYDRVQNARRGLRRQRVYAAVGIVLLTLPALAVPGFLLYANLNPAKYAVSGAESTLAVVAALDTIFACIVGRIFMDLRSSMWLTVTAALPLSDRRRVWHTWSIAAAASAISLYPALYGFGFIAYVEKLGPIGWCVALTMSVVQWLVALGLGTLLAAYWPSFPSLSVFFFGIMGIPLYALAGAPGFPAVASVLFAAVPAGWLSAAFGRAYLHGVVWIWWGLIPAGVIVAGGVAGLRKLLNEFRIREFTFRSGLPALAHSDYWTARSRSLDFRVFSNALHSLLDPPLEQSAGRAGRPAKRRHVGANLVRRHFEFYANVDKAPAGFLDRLQRHFLTQREADVMAWMTAESLTWNRGYPQVLTIALAGVALAWPLSLLVGHDIAMMIILLIEVLPILLLFARAGFWFGFSAPQFGGACVPRYPLVPIAYDELSRLMLKVGCFRGLLLVPLLLSVTFTMSVATQSQSAWLAWGLGALLVAFLYLTAHGWIIAARFAETMSWPTPRHGVWPWRIVRIATSAPGCALLVFVSFIVSATTLGLLHDFGYVSDAIVPYFCFTWIALFVLASIASWLCVRLMYRRHIVDLVRSRPSLGQQSWQQMEQLWYAPRGPSG
jgi:hypothetical protein